jgi:transcriptional regulatory protein RtcR
MSALFGHSKGAFTGATTARAGLLKAADGGMLFLDEIGELGCDEQAMLLRAIEEKRFLPVGSDREVDSGFQLIAGTNCDLQSSVREGRFREDLLARINLWTFCMPGLAERRDDIAPNLEYEIERCGAKLGRKITINKEARELFLRFAESSDALWTANFRDLNAAVTRMATLCHGGRITADDVAEEVERLKRSWKNHEKNEFTQDVLRTVYSDEQIETLDLFDQGQLSFVIKVCRESKSLAEAGRKLYSISRLSKAQPNDSDRLRKYLSRFELDWSDLVVT